MTSMVMFARVGLQGVFFLTLVYLLSADEFGAYSTVLSIALLIGTICALGGNYLFASEVNKLGSDLKQIGWPLFLINMAASLFANTLVFIIISILSVDDRLSWTPWVFLLLISEGSFGKSVEFLSILLQAEKRFAHSQMVIAAPAAAKASCVILALVVKLHGIVSIVLLLSVVNVLTWVLVVSYLIYRRTIFPKGFKKSVYTLRNLKTSRFFIANQSAANGVLFFVGDGAKPLVALFVPPNVLASYSAALRFLEVAMIPIKSFLFEVLHRWFDGSLTKAGETRLLASKLIRRAGLSGSLFALAVFCFGWAYQAKYPSFVQWWIWITPLIVFRTCAYALGDFLIAAGRPITRAICLIIVPLILAIVLASSYHPNGVTVAIALLLAESAALILLLISSRTAIVRDSLDKAI